MILSLPRHDLNHAIDAEADLAARLADLGPLAIAEEPETARPLAGPKPGRDEDDDDDDSVFEDLDDEEEDDFFDDEEEDDYYDDDEEDDDEEFFPFDED